MTDDLRKTVDDAPTHMSANAARLWARGWNDCLAHPDVAAALRIKTSVDARLQEALDQGADGDAVRVCRDILDPYRLTLEAEGRS